MTKRTRIRIKEKPRKVFQMRVAGLAFLNDHVLVHRATHEKFWSFPGGRAEIGETSVETLKREMVEELGVEVSVGPLLWVVENFYEYEKKKLQELGFYYRMEVPERFPFHPSDIIHRNRDGKNDLEFRWVEATTDALVALDIPPYFIAAEIEHLPETPRHLVWHDGDLDDK
ncbi:NUDIX hydrolase [Rhizobium halophytocola]|uniref:8-oxo-dGTP pyrophosphatase MutT (NUDIX family) n=1 Tax=Rhizobium halophytocola TaxID=735519 RepID=A0ABS4DT17_9HYPH|nr:NUDIX hydrolase [Rhizobium halophytocola]MBP1848846.1 8-oxo-dGTP pyrophosphatase MutT (NUDIX family) [Rhizobium halophytocola]